MKEGRNDQVVLAENDVLLKDSESASLGSYMVWVGGIVLVLLVLLLVASFRSSPEKEYSKVISGDITPVVIATGRVSAMQSSLVLTSVAGRLKSINVLPGEDVSAGQLLAELENPKLKQALEDAELLLMKSRNIYEKTKIEQELLINSYQKKLRTARQRLEILKLKSQSNAKLLEKKIISKLDYQIAKINFKQAEDDFRYANDELELHNVIRQKILQSAKNEVSLQQKKYLRSKNRYSALSIVAPSEGTVLELADSLETGKLLGSGDPVLTIFDSEKLSVNIRLPPKLAQKVRVGNKIDANIDGTAYRASVIAIDQQIKQGAVSVLAKFDQQTLSGLRPNLDIPVKIYLDDRENVLKISKQNWYHGPGTYTASHKSSNKKPVKIKVGLSDFKYAEIESGVSEGDVIEISPAKVN